MSEEKAPYGLRDEAERMVEGLPPQKRKHYPEEWWMPGPWFLLQRIKNWDDAAEYITELQTENKRLNNEVIKLKSRLKERNDVMSRL